MKKLIGLLAFLVAGPAQAQATLPDLLAAIEIQLLQKRPDFVATLRPPLSAAQIGTLEVKYATTVPDDVKALYMWHDGQNPESFDTFVDNMQFQPLEVALSTKADLDGMIGHDFELENWWHPGWLPVFHNGGGDYLVVDTVGVHTGDVGQLVTVYHDWKHRPIAARNLLVFAQAVLSYYEKTRPQDMDNSHLLEGHLADTNRSFEASGTAKPVN